MTFFLRGWPPHRGKAQTAHNPPPPRPEAYGLHFLYCYFNWPFWKITVTSKTTGESENPCQKPAGRLARPADATGGAAYRLGERRRVEVVRLVEVEQARQVGEVLGPDVVADRRPDRLLVDDVVTDAARFPADRQRADSGDDGDGDGDGDDDDDADAVHSLRRQSCQFF